MSNKEWAFVLNLSLKISHKFTFETGKIFDVKWVIKFLAMGGKISQFIISTFPTGNFILE